MTVSQISQSSSIDPFSSSVLPDVADLQASLNTVGGQSLLAVDGIFGPKTRAELERFQRSMNLPVTGYPDEPTLEHLERAASLATDGTDSLEDANQATASAPRQERRVPDTTLDSYARTAERAFSADDVVYQAKVVAGGVIDGTVGLATDIVNVTERTAGGLGVLGSERFNEIGEQNLALANAIYNLARHPIASTKALYKALVMDELARLNGRDGIRAIGSTLGGKLAEHNVEKMAEAIVKELLKDGGYEKFIAYMQDKYGINVRVGGNYVAALKYAFDAQKIIGKAGDAAKELGETDPELYRFLQGSALQSEGAEDLQMLYFLMQPLRDEVRATIERNIDAYVPTE